MKRACLLTFAVACLLLAGAVAALGMMGARAKEEDALRRATKDDDADVRRRAEEALREMERFKPRCLP